ncbi:Neuropeptide-Like Protein [Caenorhabditis elegans]|uniref:Neuropeptide-Like Protein n=1 Tax=Caenorhabditis elegans TaxID=6239 RepID=B3WFW3_CAEEL|nr:Neuropeptide-Like Protein [Caenorhabditis elegans]CAQ76484.1 Neuropeptide-Like Protein [Caenorhabditis elegans]|eukprot:NP_001129780.1 Uncharacterized protein CELE_F59C6.16 [Caenorhabditis elegans]
MRILLILLILFSFAYAVSAEEEQHHSEGHAKMVDILRFKREYSAENGSNGDDDDDE